MKIPNQDCLLFFTDLDGTLLDHKTYSYESAWAALDALRKNNIPLILASSKTAAEIEPLRQKLGFEHCEAIVENGAGILFPGNSKTGSSDAYLNLLDKLSNVPSKYRAKFRGFSEQNIEELSQLTGLTKNSAALAKERQFSEPGIWSGGTDDLDIFLGLLNDQGIDAQKGGRFLTLSFGMNKVDRMLEIASKHRVGANNRFCVALGDAPNDVAMLEAANLGIIIPNTSHNGISVLPAENTGKVIRAQFQGPEGWNEAVLDVLMQAGKP